MIETCITLLAAHLISDFVLQWDWMVANKHKPRVLIAHVLIVGFTTAALLGARDAQAYLAVLIIVITHLLIDKWKLKQRDTMLAFVADQLAHVAVIAVVAICLPKLAQNGLWALLPGDMQADYFRFLVVISGIVIAVPLGGIMIKKLIKPIVPSSSLGAQGPQNVGRYIGWLERALTFGFIMVGKPEGVGFLLAAKSVLRFGDLQNNQQHRSQAEYIIVGTFLSFGWALLIAYASLLVAARYATS